jgi:hypothetical protein
MDNEKCKMGMPEKEAEQAMHRLLISAPSLNRQKILSFLERMLLEFQAVDGHVKTGTNAFGERGPELSCENGVIVPYDAGRLLGEQYISSGIFR